MSTHVTTCTDEMVRLKSDPSREVRGTVARCTCGWSSSWWVRDGSAEADASQHMRAVDPVYAKLRDAQDAKWLAEHKAQQAEVKARRNQNQEVAPRPSVDQHRHNCSCHISAPCGACERCRHWDAEARGITDCPNDCQECEEHEDV